MSNRRRLRRRHRLVVPPCPDCASELLWLPTGPFLAHDETCPSWRARTVGVRAAVGPEPVVLLLREVWP